MKHMEKKGRWELYKNAMCCFEQIQEATLHKIAVVWLPSSHLPNHPNKMNKMWGTAGEVMTLISNILFDTTTHRCTCIGLPAKSYIHEFCVNTGYSSEDLTEMIGDWDSW